MWRTVLVLAGLAIIPVVLLVTAAPSTQCQTNNCFRQDKEWPETGFDCEPMCGDAAVCNDSCTACESEAIIFQQTWRWDCRKESTASTSSYTLTQIDVGDGSGAWADGARYLVDLDNWDPVSIENYNGWGTNVEPIPNPASIGMMFRIDTHSDPSKRKIVVEKFLTKIPTFTHTATSPGKTGENQIKLRPNFTSVGEVDVTTGDVWVTVYGELTNSHIPQSEAKNVILKLSGEIDSLVTTASITTEGIVYERE